MTMKKWLAALLAVVMLMSLSAACGQEAGVELPERGLLLPLTEADTQSGLEALSVGFSDGTGSEIPGVVLMLADQEAIDKVRAQYTEEQQADPALQEQINDEIWEHVYQVYTVMLLPENQYVYYQDVLVESEESGLAGVFEMGRNEGWVYVAMTMPGLTVAKDPAAQPKVDAAVQRSREILENAVFQPVVKQSGGAFPSFSTVDLNGNPVTDEIFAGKDLTVVNVWGTFCGPCINEMDELAAWSQSMPENVQLIGLVSDLYSATDTETLETALAICEATGASVYPSLVSCQDFYPLLSTVVGVPTTFFVDGNGQLVGEPIVGANVPGCMAFVEAYLNGEK